MNRTKGARYARGRPRLWPPGAKRREKRASRTKERNDIGDLSRAVRDAGEEEMKRRSRRNGTVRGSLSEVISDVSRDVDFPDVRETKQHADVLRSRQ